MLLDGYVLGPDPLLGMLATTRILYTVLVGTFVSKLY